MDEDSRNEQEEIDAAAAEARRIGGTAGDEDLDPAERPLAEAGEGVAEGFEEAEDDLIDHASHGDLHSGRVPYYDREKVEEEPGNAEYGEADHEIIPEIEDQD